MKPRLNDGALVGAVLIAPLIAASYLGWKLDGLPFVPFDLFDWVARALPGRMVTAGIDTTVALLRAAPIGSMSAAAKMAEQAMAIGGCFAAALVGGSLLFSVFRLSDESAQLLGAVVGGIVGGLAVVVEHSLRRVASAVSVDAVWVFGMFVAWGVASGWAYDRLHATAPSTGTATGGRVDRRAFLIRVAWAAALPSILTTAWGVAVGARRRTAGTRWSDSHLLPNAGAGVTPVPGTRAEFTALEDHYRVDTDTRAPTIDGNRWRLRIGGLVDNPRELTLDDLRREEPLDQFVTLSCISNPPGGDLIGTTRWTGVSVQGLLRRFHLRPGATHLKITSADGFFEVVSLEAIENDRRLMLTYAWDGVPLLVEHGFPLRLYIPDVYGMKQPKWIDAIEVSDRWEPGYWVARGWDREGRMKATSVVDAVDTRTSALDVNGRRLASVGGIAHAGARRISKVEVRVDGREWRDARLRDALSDTTWVVWRAELPLEPDDHIVSVRCFEGDGRPQSDPYYTKPVKRSS